MKLAYDELDRFNWNEKDLIAYEETIMDLRKEEAILTQKLGDAREEGIKFGAVKIAKNLLNADVSIELSLKRPAFL
jgi:hypothetical protein